MYQRSINLDVARGSAIILMAVFHFSYYMSNFMGWKFSYDDPKVYLSRLIIMTLFLGCAGIGLSLQAKRGFNWPRFFYRTGRLGLGALLISSVSYLIVPGHWIYFGILQFLFVATLVGALFTYIPRVSLFTGIAVIVGHFLITAQFYPGFSIYLSEQLNTSNLQFYFSFQFLFNFLQPILNLPNSTFDITYFIPWFGIVLIGIYIGHLNFSIPSLKNVAPFNFLSWLGKHSLVAYFAHAAILAPIALVIEWMINGNQSTLATAISNFL